jgi:predicted kinase
LGTTYLDIEDELQKVDDELDSFRKQERPATVLRGRVILDAVEEDDTSDTAWDRPRPPIAIMLLGIGGVGKSSAAGELHALLLCSGYDAILIRFDELRKELAPVGADPFSDDPEVKRIIYENAARRFAELLAQGKSLVIDCGLSKESIRRQLKSQIPALRIVHLHCPLPIAIYRDCMRSLWGGKHERGPFLHLRAVWCKLLGRSPGHRKFFPQPGITYQFESPDCADAHINTWGKTPQCIAQEIFDALKLPR